MRAALLSVVAVVACLCGPAAHADEVRCDVPRTVSLSAPEDYPLHEPRIRACLAELLANPVDADEERLRRRQGYVLKWLAGVPYVSVRVRLDGAARSAIKAAKGRDPGLQSWYVYGLAQQSLIEGSDPVQIEASGLAAMVGRYRAMREAGLKKNKVLEAWMELDPAGLRELAAASVQQTELSAR